MGDGVSTKRRELIEGLYKVGDRLPPERDIADRLDVSRTVVKRYHHAGAWKLSWKWKKVRCLCLRTFSIILARIAVSKWCWSFEMLQAANYWKVISRVAATQVLRAAIIKMRSALELEREELASGTTDCSGDERFHMCIAEATQNSVLVDMCWNNPGIDAKKSQCGINSHSLTSSGQDYREEGSLDDHARILAALRRKESIIQLFKNIM